MAPKTSPPRGHCPGRWACRDGQRRRTPLSGCSISSSMDEFSGSSPDTDLSVVLGWPIPAPSRPPPPRRPGAFYTSETEKASLPATVALLSPKNIPPRLDAQSRRPGLVSLLCRGRSASAEIAATPAERYRLRVERKSPGRGEKETKARALLAAANNCPHRSFEAKPQQAPAPARGFHRGVLHRAFCRRHPEPSREQFISP